MKEILFRGKDEKGKWHYGDLVHEAFDGNSMIIPIGIREKINGHYCYPVEVIPETVGQFTGKIDKNGIKIFEYDIVLSEKLFYNTKKAIVKWLEDRCSFYFVANTTGTDIINRKPFQSAYKINSFRVEVIGNIHDN